MRAGWKIRATSKVFHKIDLAKAVNASMSRELRDREKRKHTDDKGSVIDIDHAAELEPEVGFIIPWLRQNPLTLLFRTPIQKRPRNKILQGAGKWKLKYEQFVMEMINDIAHRDYDDELAMTA